MTIETILLAAVLGCIPGAIAQKKGHDFVGWWIYGSLLFVVALPHSLMLKPKSQQAVEEAKAQPAVRFGPLEWYRKIQGR